MTTLEELEKQKETLEAQIAEAKKRQKDEDLKLVRQLCKRHGFTHNMLKNYLKPGRKSGK